MIRICTVFLEDVWENWAQRRKFADTLREDIEYWREDVSMSGGDSGYVPLHCEILIKLCDRYLSSDDETTFWRITRVAQATEAFSSGGLRRDNPMRAQHERWLKFVIDDCCAELGSERAIPLS